jgi:hypothetical protein
MLFARHGDQKWNALHGEHRNQLASQSVSYNSDEIRRLILSLTEKNWTIFIKDKSAKQCLSWDRQKYYLFCSPLKRNIWISYSMYMQQENLNLLSVRSVTHKTKVIVGRAIAQPVSRRLPTAAARVRPQVRSCGICGGRSGAGACVLRVIPFPLPILIPQTTPHSQSSSSSSSIIRAN